MKYGGLVELFVVLMFVAGWGILELVTRRMDRRRTAHDEAGTRPEPRDPGSDPGGANAGSAADAASKEASRHPER